ncbi:MAG: hypothetical protein KFH98_09765 [Gemmatimonadetes bacterium]|nr:hypothetical protein [Gemmatimonadota bacterium]
MITTRRLTACFIACPLALAACDEPLSPPSSSAVQVSVSSDARQVTVPFESHFFTTETTLAPDPVCGALPRLLNIQEGSGEATHLGRFSIRISFCVDATDILDDGQLTEGESLPYDGGVGVFTAANGDELHITIAGAVLPSDHPDFDFEFDDPYVVTGGTGRFAGATGGGTSNSFVRLGVATTHNWAGSLTFRPGR